MATYTPSNGTEDTTYFQDVAISPATLADGTLRRRFDPKRYPKLGTTASIAPIIASVTGGSVAHGASGTLTINGQNLSKLSTVTVSGAGVTVVVNSDADHKGQSLTCTVTATSGAATGQRNLTVTNTDGGTATSNNAITVT